jgi:phage head maturation protease
VLWGHNPEEPENVLGTASDLQIAGDGSQTTATLTFDTDINSKAGLVFDQIKRGTLRTVSVGFRNHTLEWDNDDPILKDKGLLH